ncbi:AMP-binding protein [Ruficoccus sp. ZRK36]|uniref:AMP-binding protein n=1 Tax=Ruficoccus sp. ZRK36 TaxID=2866311 RepID=UPI001C72C212|nr:AMP-binding protein [Ruficoccus sp. ZRK36]QYY36588.1 AMP-binding protein [Ruficoccus sp. ZRK36]
MEATVAAFRERLKKPWLDEHRQGAVVECFEARLDTLTAFLEKEPTATILLAEEDATAFLGSLLAAVALGAPVFLANPAWRQNEWSQVAAQLQPSLVWGHTQLPHSLGLQELPMAPYRGHIMIPTGGTGGRVRFAMHRWETLAAAVKGYATFFDQQQLNAWCTLPLWHVSGLMQAMRTFMSGGRLMLADYREQVEPGTGMPDRSAFHLSLVPTQLGRMLAQPGGGDWLRGFGLLLLGGAAVPEDLQDRARQAGLHPACSYGMTETSAVIAIQRPEAFEARKPLAGEILPHAQVSIGAEGIAIQARSLFRGYYPEVPAATEVFYPGDDGELDEAGRLHVSGRRDRIIITGGEKVDPLEVEAAIRRSNPEAEALVTGEPDPDWGQCVVALVAGVKEQELKPLQKALQSQLQPASNPKRWLWVDTLPLKPNGKVDRDRLAQLLAPPGE